MYLCMYICMYVCTYVHKYVGEGWRKYQLNSFVSSVNVDMVDVHW